MENINYGYLLVFVLILSVYYLYSKAYGLKVYWFHRPDCGYCTEMKPEWDALEKKLNTTSIHYRRIDINDSKNKKISKNFGVVGVPHIVKIDYEGSRHIYSGDRRCNDILAWLYE